MATLLLMLYFLCPLFIALLPGILREDAYEEQVNDLISLTCVFVGSLLLGLVLPHQGFDAYTSVTRMLILSFLLVLLPPRQELTQYLQTHIHLSPKRIHP